MSNMCGSPAQVALGSVAGGGTTSLLDELAVAACPDAVDICRDAILNGGRVHCCGINSYQQVYA